MTKMKKKKLGAQCSFCLGRGKWLCPQSNDPKQWRLFFCPDCRGSGNKAAPTPTLVEFGGKIYLVTSMVLEPIPAKAEEEPTQPDQIDVSDFSERDLAYCAAALEHAMGLTRGDSYYVYQKLSKRLEAARQNRG